MAPDPTLCVDRVARTGRGPGAELLPEPIDLGERGPILKNSAAPDRLHGHARQAVAARPRLALHMDGV
ncbi:ferredoxin [Streptomyces sp. NPDC021080]|uniref:ferredoxin n=1 Tax=Streptomyces sp. NPDC021080 TaxID=3365110 RepID=UPI0037BAFEEF